jgi:hypothetical protein
MVIMNRIVPHHAASSYEASQKALNSYHRLVDGAGNIINGKFAIEANAPGKRLMSGYYAAHTAKLNTGSIGVSILAMGDAQWSKPFGGKYPVRLVQVEALVKETAQLAIDYSVECDRRTILSHAEVEITLGVAQKGKWDFDYDMWGKSSSRDPVGLGDEFRQEVARLMKTLKPRIKQVDVAAIELDMGLQTLRQGSVGYAVSLLQERLRKLYPIWNIEVDGAFGPATRDAVKSHQRAKQLLADGVVGKMTWASLFPEEFK